jgi:SAM-dependent methyltransferase
MKTISMPIQIELIEWFKLLCESYVNPPIYHCGIPLPGFPPDQLQINTTGQAGAETLKEAFVFYLDCLEQFSLLGKPVQEEHCLLDFGVGWGRISRFFLREISAKNIFGIDVTPEFIDICKRTFRSNNFIVTNPFPPTPIPDKRFDFIVAYSVFSHLSEKACSAWMNEFSRILQPGGVIAITTRGRTFLDTCEFLRSQEVSGYTKAMSLIFEDFADARMRYDRGEFLHSNIEGVSGGGAMNSSFYGETLIPEPYARAAYAKQFKLEKFLFDPGRQIHPIMFFRKTQD